MNNLFRSKLVLLFFLFSLPSCGDYEWENKKRQPSAQQNVKVLENQFDISSLNRKRQIRIYLPPDYDVSEKRFPVLYMHDGQNLFDDATSYAGEWGVDEALNDLYKNNRISIIVVGIDNGQEKRMNELSPWENPKFGDPEGEQYMSFVIDTIKPFIDTKYRTLKDRENTGIMGSSMGGLISHFAIFQYADVFSKAGIFSPSFWFSEKAYPYTRVSNLQDNTRLYYLMGSEEGRQMVKDMERMVTLLKEQGMDTNEIRDRVVEGGTHSEKFWRDEFKDAVLWLFNE